MPDQTPQSRPASFFLGASVVVLYAIFVSAVFAGFASYIYRAELSASLALDSSEIGDVDNLIYTVQREAFLSAQLSNQLDLVQAMSEARETEQAALSSLKLQYEDESDRLPALVGPARVQLQSAMPLLAPVDREKLRQVLGLGRPAEVIEALSVVQTMTLVPAQEGDGAAATMAARIGLDAARGSFEIVDATMVELKVNISQLTETVEKIDVALQEETEKLEAAQQDLSVLRETLPLGAPGRARLEALSTDVPFVGDVFQRLVSFPTIFLTLIVTIAAGGLGTVVAFSRRYYGHADVPPPSASHLYVNIGEGIAAALAIFLFAGAGMLALTTGGGSNNAAELSPYTVAFIAFVSGFMAEDAFRAIGNAGKRLFENQQDAQARQLAAAAGASEVTIDDDSVPVIPPAEGDAKAS